MTNLLTNAATNAAIALSVSVVSVSFTNYLPSGAEMFVKTITSREHKARYRVAGKLETLTRLEPIGTNVARFVAKVVWTEVPLNRGLGLMGVPDLPPLPPGLSKTNKP